MSGIKLLAVVLIVAGIAGLAYGKFSYTKSEHEAKIGPFNLSVQEKKTVNIPLWAGIAAIAGGVVLIVLPKRG